MFIILMLIAGVVGAQDMILPPSQAISNTEPILHPDCPTVDDKFHPVMLPFPNDCAKYYSCLSGYAYTMHCPLNLHWSILNYRCDYPEVAKCLKLSPLPYPGQLPLPSPPAGQDVPIYHADTHNCNQYYQCQKMHCPMNMFWSDRLQRCDLPHLTECAANYPPTSIPTPTIQPVMPPIASTPPATPATSIETATQPQFLPSKTVNELDELCSKYNRLVYINYPGDCHRFIQCNGFASVHTCPANLYWNSILKTCDTYCI